MHEASVTPTLIYLRTPLVEDPAAFAPLLRAATAAGTVAAVMLRLPAAEERRLVNTVKALAPAAQERGAAVVVSIEGEGVEALDLGRIATRGGAEGVHVRDLALARTLREGLPTDRVVGISGLKARHDAMSAGEIGLDYLLFGEPRADGSIPALDQTLERAAWWAEIFETPCVAFAPSLADVAAAGETGAEFVGLGEAVFAAPEGPVTALAGVKETLAAIDAERARRAAEAAR